MVSKQQTVWRESASLMVATRRSADARDCDYELLMLKRSDRTAVAPNQCVFPGGMLEAADESVEWLKYFEEFGVPQQALKRLVVVSEQRPRVLAARGNGCYDRFFNRSCLWAREISLRITAIRETFEEVGLLLCRQRQQLCDLTKVNYACVKTDFDRTHWQHVVHNDPKKFLHLCRELNVVPDLWGIYEWSAWASPAMILKGFETVFFITFLTEVPQLIVEPSEVKSCLWRSPAALLQMFSQDELWFLPPQIYELMRFRRVRSMDVLQEFARERCSKDITLYMPVGYMCADGAVYVLPGDDFYVDNPRSLNDFIPVHSTMEEFRAKAKRVHRYENVGMLNMTVHMNFAPLNGHLSPIGAPYKRNKL